jgi:Acetyltransferase (GNAT) domain
MRQPSGLVPLISQGSLSVSLLHGVDEEREAAERDLVALGVPLPLPHSCAWARLIRCSESWFLAVRNGGKLCGGFALEVTRSRALPGHVLLRAERFGAGCKGDSLEISIAALGKLASVDRRILRVNVESFSRDAQEREAIEVNLRARQFQRSENARRYPRTVAIDLSPDEAGILKSFNATARQNVRAVNKHPVRIGTLDFEHIPRIAELYRETMSRTGGKVQTRDWAGIIDLSKSCPDRSRLVGLFRTDVQQDCLLAFAWGCGHGDYVHYSTAASTRNTDLRMPLAYPLVWDLICWGKRHGARWFDLGGVTDGHHGSGDALGGISDFKRYFSKDVVTVGDEWVIEPRPVKARLARAVSAGAALISCLRLGRAKSQ